jgi:hypothetical protein
MQITPKKCSTTIAKNSPKRKEGCCMGWGGGVGIASTTPCIRSSPVARRSKCGRAPSTIIKAITTSTIMEHIKAVSFLSDLSDFEVFEVFEMTTIITDNKGSPDRKSDTWSQNISFLNDFTPSQFFPFSNARYGDDTSSSWNPSP